MEDFNGDHYVDLIAYLALLKDLHASYPQIAEAVLLRRAFRKPSLHSIPAPSCVPIASKRTVRSMTIQVTAEDMEDAMNVARRNKMADGGGWSWHNFANPIAKAMIEREMKGAAYAAVSPRFVCIAHQPEIGGREQRFPVNGQNEIFIREWCRGVAQPTRIDLKIISPVKARVCSDRLTRA